VGRVSGLDVNKNIRKFCEETSGRTPSWKIGTSRGILDDKIDVIFGRDFVRILGAGSVSLCQEALL
jgi:hypothetical protein